MNHEHGRSSIPPEITGSDPADARSGDGRGQRGSTGSGRETKPHPRGGV